MKELTRDKLGDACTKKGFILIAKKPIKKSRIHYTSCYSLHKGEHDPVRPTRGSDKPKAKIRYYFSDFIDELKEKIKSDANRDIENLLCTKCLPEQK